MAGVRVCALKPTWGWVRLWEAWGRANLLHASSFWKLWKRRAHAYFHELAFREITVTPNGRYEGGTQTCWPQPLLAQAPRLSRLLLRVFSSSFFLRTSVALVSGRWRVSRQLGTWISRNLTITQDLHQWGRTDFGEVVGPFEEEEEGTGIASDVVKVEDEDPDTQVYLMGDRMRLGCRRSRVVGASPLARSRWNPRTVHNDSPISV